MPTDFDAFRTVLYYCIAILALPISTFFFTKLVILNGLFGVDSVPGNVYAAISAVIVLHLALGVFIYKAYSGDDAPRKPEKLD